MLNKHQQKVMDDCPTAYKGVLDRAYQGKSREAAIRAFCLRCVGFRVDDVKNCTSYGCPLYVVRPYQKDEAASGE